MKVRSTARMLHLVLLPLLVGFSDGCNRVPKTVTLEDNTQIQLMDPSFLTIPKLVLEEGVDAIRDGVEYPPLFVDPTKKWEKCLASTSPRRTPNAIYVASSIRDLVVSISFSVEDEKLF